MCMFICTIYHKKIILESILNTCAAIFQMNTFQLNQKKLFHDVTPTIQFLFCSIYLWKVNLIIKERFLTFKIHICSRMKQYWHPRFVGIPLPFASVLVFLFSSFFQVAYVIFDFVFNVGNRVILCCIDSCACSDDNTHQCWRAKSCNNVPSQKTLQERGSQQTASLRS